MCLYKPIPETWLECYKKDICESKLTYGNEYKPVKSDLQFLDNWVERYKMLCEPKYKIGLLGSFFFIGIVSSILFMPTISDVYGR